MTWWMDKRRHVIESKNRTAREVYCGLCNKIILKNECTKYRLTVTEPKQFSLEQRRKMSESHKGRKHTEEHKRKIALSLLATAKAKKESNIQLP